MAYRLADRPIAALTLWATLVPVAATAQVTPEVLLDEWSNGTPPEIHAAETVADGGIFSLTDVTVTLAEGVVLTTPSATLEADGDTTVIRPADSLTLSIESDDAAPLTALMEAPGATILAEGTPGAIAYTLTAQTLTARGSGEDATDTEAVFEDLTAAYDPGGGEDLTVEIAAATATALTETEAGTEATAEQVASRTETTIDAFSLLTTADPEALADMASSETIAEAGPVRTTLTGEGLSQVTSTELTGGDTVVSDVETGTFTLSYGIDAGRLTHQGTVGDVVSRSQIPGGVIDVVEVLITSVETDFDLPLSAPDDPAPYDLSTAFTGIEISDRMWEALDPASSLPRDPALISIAGEGTVIVRPAEASTGGFREGGESNAGTGAALVEPKTLSITDLTVEGFGASLTGAGDLTFGTPGAAPIGPAVGEIELQGTGITRVLDALSEAGVVQPVQALGARMFLGMFAREGDTPGSLATTLEFGEDGAVRVNGLPIARLPL